MRQQKEELDERSFQMDIKTLVVGQDVYMLGGNVYIKQGRVVKATMSSVEVESGGDTYYFDAAGRERYRTSCKWGPEWCLQEIDDMPFEERKAELERGRREVSAAALCKNKGDE